MSNHLSIAAVTATLGNLIQSGINGHGMSATLTHVRPDTLGGATAASVNLYLYQVTTNAAWRNIDMPARNASGQLIKRPKVALDLHYLLSFYGNESSLEPQRLLTLAVSTLHAVPVLTREKIRSIVRPGGAVNGSYPFLFDSDLDDELELVKFTPIPLSLEELSKVWSVFFQTHYTLSIAYQATVVLVDADVAPVVTLPVRETRFYSEPYQQIVVDSILNNADTALPITRSSTLLVKGSGFSGENIRVRIGGEEVTPTVLSDKELTLVLASVPAGGLRAGVQGLQVIRKRPMGIPEVGETEGPLHNSTESNVAAFVLRPTIATPIADGTTNVDDVTTINVTLVDTVGKSQRALLYLNESSAPATASHTLVATRRTADGTALEFKMKGLGTGTFLARVQIDGAESLLTVDGTTKKYNGPTVTLT